MLLLIDYLERLALLELFGFLKLMLLLGDGSLEYLLIASLFGLETQPKWVSRLLLYLHLFPCEIIQHLQIILLWNILRRAVHDN